MADNYSVNYNIRVNSAGVDTALTSFQNFTTALVGVQDKLKVFETGFKSSLTRISQAMNSKKMALRINTHSAHQKLNQVEARLKRIQTMAGSINLGAVGGGGGTGGGRGASGGGKSAAPKNTQTSYQPVNNWSGPIRHPNAVGYKAFGATPLPNNGGMAIDMLKGMGIAYGIAGVAGAISDIVRESAHYDNTMKTVENILKSHDDKGDFSNRFSSMSRTIRNVGVETKFKVTEVADAAKFLAMAGLDVEAIQQSIRPIADIALVGDTELGETADLVTNIMTAYNIAPGKMRNAADVMTNTFTMSNTTLTEIAESYKYAASLLSAGGISFEEATAAIGVLGDAGIKGSQAGTTLRTIMANVVNPTKKQRAAWKEVGVSTVDSSGNTKDLLTLFKELSAKDLDVADYYRLFHKTAASGAVALSSHVGKWENVYLENFLSAGLSANLADAKKNTLQGLWAQLTSTFTDNGVTAFEDVQGGIRAWIKQATAWLKTDEVKKGFRDVANTVMEFVKTIIDATKWFARLYETFSPIIKTWMKFQLMIWPLVKAVQAFKAVWIGTNWLGSIANNLRSVAVGMESIAVATTNANDAAVQGGAANAAAGVAAGAGAKGGFWASVKNHPINAWKDTKSWFKNVWSGNGAIGADAAMRVGGVARMGIGALGAYAAMNQITKDDVNSLDYLSGGLYGAAGLAFMTGAPYIAAGLAVAGLLASVAAAKERLRDLQNYVAEFTANNKILDGVVLNSSSRTERMLEFVWRRNYDINSLIERRIELSKTLHGVESPGKTESNDVTAEVYKMWHEKFRKPIGGWWDLGLMEAREAAKVFNNDASKFGYNLSYSETGSGWFLTTKDGKKIQYKTQYDVDANANDAVIAEASAVQEMLRGPYRGKVIDEIQKRLSMFFYGQATAEDLKSLQEEVERNYNPIYKKNLIAPGKWSASVEEMKNWSGADILKSQVAANVFWASLKNEREAIEAIIDFKNKLENDTIKDHDVIKALRLGDYNILGTVLADYNPHDVLGWFRNQGFKNGSWFGMNGETPEAMAQMAAGNMQKLLDAIKQLGLAAHPATQAIQDHANIMLTLAQSYLNKGDELSGKKNGETKVVNGQTWRWNSKAGVWELLDEKGELAQVSQALVDFANGITTVKNALNNSQSVFPNAIPFQVPNGVDSSFLYLQNNNADHGMRYSNPISKKNSAIPSWSVYGGVQDAATLNTKTGMTSMTMTPQQMGNVFGANVKGGKDGANGTAGSAPKASDYSSKKSGSNAAPKQVIVRINNLMNVQSVDLANPRKAEVIAGIKQELAQALVDVVHDFDESWHG